MSLDIADIKPQIGSTVTATAASLVSGEHAEELRALLVKRGVLVFRDLRMTADEQREFTSTLGNLRLGSVKQEGDRGLQKVSLDKKENPEYAEFFPGTFFWHMDGTYDPVPPFATTLRPAESYDLIQRLMRHATQPQFVYRHQWQPNDLVMWDNTGTMHRVRPYPADSGRLLHRFTLDGEEPIAAELAEAAYA